MAAQQVQAQEPIEIDKLVFGAYYSMCKGNCVRVYELDNAGLRRDDSARYGSLNWAYYFSGTTKMTAEQHKAALPLLKKVPLELCNKNRVVIGNPDSHDQGGIYLEIISGPADVRMKLDIDDTPEQSAEVRAFKRQLMGLIEEMK
ncbi:MAG: hypothetical protein JNM41_02430 [Flavipsychrobacter sp.]|nr:hypothetical protein [Flavipsychrobacter sp.]